MLTQNIIQNSEQKPLEQLVELLEALSENLDLLLTKKSYLEWVIQHLELLLDCLWANQRSVEISETLIKKIFTQIEPVISYLTPQNTQNSQDAFIIAKDHQRLMRCYEQAQAIAGKMKLADTVRESLEINSASFKLVATNQSNPRNLPHINTLSPNDISESLKTYHGYLLEALKNNNKIKIAQLQTEINVIETQFLYRMLMDKILKKPWIEKHFAAIGINDRDNALIKFIKHLAAKLVYCNNHTRHGAEFSCGILRLFIACREYACKNLLVLKLVKEISNLMLGITKPETKLFDWQRYRIDLFAYRKKFAEQLKLGNTPACQKNFTNQMQQFTGMIIQDCINLLEPAPKVFCFLALGSMSNQMMCPYSDLEFALLIEEPTAESKIYLESLLNLFAFKICSIGEHSLSARDEKIGSAGFHLDEDGYPGASEEATLRLYGTPKEIIGNCQPGTKITINQIPEEIKILDHQSYSLYQANYLYGDKNLWEAYQKERDCLLNSPDTTSLRQKVVLADLAAVAKKLEQQKTDIVDLKYQIVAPIIYFITDLKLFYNLPSQLFPTEIIDELVKQNILHKPFAIDLIRALNFGQYLRCKYQFKDQRQIKPEKYLLNEQDRRTLAQYRDTIYALHHAIRRFAQQQFSRLPYNPVHEDYQELIKSLPTKTKPQLDPTTVLENLVSFLTQTKADLKTYRQYYLGLNDNLRMQMLEIILRVEKIGRDEFIYWELAKYQNQDGKSPAFLREENNWLKQLQYLLSPIRPQHSNAPRIVFAHGKKILGGYLNSDVFSQIWDSQKNDFKSGCGGKHLVWPVMVQNDIRGKTYYYHIKLCPENSGYELAVQLLHRLTIGHGTSISSLGYLEIYIDKVKRKFPVLISKTVSGHEFEQQLDVYLHTHQQQELVIDSKCYAQLILLSLFVNPEDHKSNNLILTHNKTLDGTKKTLVAIDNDHAFVKPVVDGWRTKIYTKSILYCLKQFQQPLDSTAILEFLNFNPEIILNHLLNELRDHGDAWESLFTPTEIEYFASKKESLLRLVFPFGLIGKIYQEFIALQNLLRTSLSYRKPITAQLLLQKKHIKLGNFYEELHNKYSSPYFRFAEILKLYYQQQPTKENKSSNVKISNLPKYVTSTPSAQILTLSGLGKNMVLLAKENKYRPRDALKELQYVVDGYAWIYKFKQAFESNDKNQIQAGLQKIREFTGPAFASLKIKLINELNFAKVIKSYHQELLNFLPVNQAHVLHLQNISFLTGSELLPILQKQLYLQELRLTNCPVSNLRLPKLDLLTYVKIENCPNLFSIIVPQQLPSLRKIDIQYKTQIKTIEGNRLDKKAYVYTEQYEMIIKNACKGLTESYIDEIINIIQRKLRNNHIVLTGNLHKKLIKFLKSYVSSYKAITTKVADKLIAVLKRGHKDKHAWNFRKSVADTLAAIGKVDNRVIAPLIVALKDKDKYVCNNALYTLGEIGRADDKVIAAVIASLEDKDCRVGAALALEVIGKVDDKIIATLISAVLGDEDWRCRAGAIHALERIGKADNKGIAALKSIALRGIIEPERAAIALVNLGKADDKIINVLIAALCNKKVTNSLHRFVVEALGKIGKKVDEKVIAALVAALRDSDSDVRQVAALDLAKLGKADEKVITALIAALGTWRARVYAAVALAKLGKVDDKIIAALIAGLEEFNTNEIVNALIKLGKANEKVIAALIAALGDDKRWSTCARVHAAETLVKLGRADEKVIATLIAALKDSGGDEDSYWIRENAAWALGEIGKADDKIITALIEALDSMNRLAVYALVKLGKADDKVIAALITASENTAPVDDHNCFFRMSVAVALVNLGKAYDKGIAVLSAALKNKSWSAREKAVWALGNLGKADDRAITLLITTALKDKNKHVRANAVEGLGRIDKADANDKIIAALIVALEDKGWGNFVRSNAANALNNICLKVLNLRFYLTKQLTELLEPYLPLKITMFGNQNLALPEPIAKKIFLAIKPNTEQERIQYSKLPLVSKTWYKFFKNHPDLQQTELTQINTQSTSANSHL